MMKYLIFLTLPVFMLFCQSSEKDEINLEGELKQWHEVTLLLQGPETYESALENPFLDYKLEVVFTRETTILRVPGYFAADGHAGETSAAGGNIWKVHFRPESAGTWDYRISFRKGKNIAVLDGENPGEAISPDGRTGTFYNHFILTGWQLIAVPIQGVVPIDVVAATIPVGDQ